MSEPVLSVDRDDKRVVVEYLTGLEPVYVGDGWWEVRYTNPHGYLSALRFRLDSDECRRSYGGGPWVDDPYFLNALYIFMLTARDLADYVVGNWADARTVLNARWQKEPLTYLRPRDAYDRDPATFVPLVGEARRLALAYLYQNLPAGVLLDYLKEAGLIPESVEA